MQREAADLASFALRWAYVAGQRLQLTGLWPKVACVQQHVAAALGDAHGLEELLKQNFAGVRIGNGSEAAKRGRAYLMKSPG